MENNYYRNLPKKRMGSGVLIFNSQDELLIVKPHYKDHWSIPGGVVDEDESPRTACIRETKEEIGIELTEVKFLCMDYIEASEEKNESLQFIFYGGKITKDQEAKIKIDNQEITEHKFASIDEAMILTSNHMKKRLIACLKAIKENTAIYLENGE